MKLFTPTTNMRQTTIEQALKNALKDKFPQATIQQLDRENHNGRPDVILNLPNETLAFEVKTSNFYDGLGRAVIMARKYGATYLVVPHELLPSQDTLDQIPHGVGILSYKPQDNIVQFELVRQSGKERLTPLKSAMETHVTQLIKPNRVSLVSTKALRIVRYLISHKNTTQVQIARETRVSLGMVNKVVSALVDRDLVSYRGKKLIVFDVWKLMNEVSWNRPLKNLKKIEVRLSNVASVQDAETELAKLCDLRKVKYALTLFSGASKYIGYGMRYDSIQAYVDQPELLQDTLNLKRVSEGISLEVYGIDSPDLIEEGRTIGEFVVCSPTQVVLDLVSYGQVGRDWAVKLYEAMLAKGG